MIIKNRQEFRRAILRGAYRGLRSQGFRQARQYVGGVCTSCVWVDIEGNRCGIGWLIADSPKPGEVLHGSAEVAIRHPKLAEPLRAAIDNGIVPADCALYDLRCIQNAHDCQHYPGEMERALEDLALHWAEPLPRDEN